jgi:hypothetical protein
MSRASAVPRLSAAAGNIPGSINLAATSSSKTEEPSHQRIAVPDHNALRIGTFTSILRAVSNHKGVTREAIVATL